MKTKRKNKIASDKKSNAKTISIFGSPESGKTTLSLYLAKEFSKKGADVVILFLDFFTPIIPIIKNYKKKANLGELLEDEKISEKKIAKSLIPIFDKGKVAGLGYSFDENAMTSFRGSNTNIENFIKELSKITDYIIFDCLSMYYADRVSLASLKLSNTAIGLYATNEKSLINFTSNIATVREMNKPLIGLNKVSKKTAVKDWKISFEDVDFLLPKIEGFDLINYLTFSKNFKSKSEIEFISAVLELSNKC